MMYGFDFEKEVFHGDMFGDIADIAIRAPMTIEHVDWLCDNSGIVFCKTDYVPQLFEVLVKILKHPVGARNRYILITHNSDYPIDMNKWDNHPGSILRWYAMNVVYESRYIIPIPSGMERPLGGGYSAHPEVIAAQLKQPRMYKNLVYMNHNQNNNHGERDFVTEYLKDKPWVTWRPHGQSFQAFIENCYTHRFVLSPPGNGIDCHRTWEALWCGSIPICKHGVLIDSFAKTLPILAVEDWSLLTEELLNIIWDEFQTRVFNYEKITFSYWKTRILNEAEELFHAE